MLVTDDVRRMSAYYEYIFASMWRVAARMFIENFNFSGVENEFHTDKWVNAVASWQRENKMHADGLMGMKTIKSICAIGTMYENCDMNLLSTVIENIDELELDHRKEFIRRNGRKVPAEFKMGQSMIYNFDQIPNSFSPRTERCEANKIVLHWDVALSSAAAWQTMLPKNQSTHFMIDADGTIYQTLDIGLDAHHTENHNSGTIGIEINNPYFTRHNKYIETKRPLHREIVPNGNKRQEHLGFTELQVESVCSLVKALLKITDIKAVVPGANTNIEGFKFKFPLDESGIPSVAVLKDDHNWRGVCGHYHLQKDKIDPGTQLWPHLIERGIVEVE